MTAGRWLFNCAIASTAALAACGGGSGGGSTLAPTPPPPAPAPAPAPAPPPVALPPQTADTPVRVSAATPFNAGCTGVAATDTVYLNAEVEPHIAVNPRDANNWVAAWQQDRWSGGSANGVVSAVTIDGGATWTRTIVPFSHCAGGNATNGGDYQRATDPWVTFSPDGTVYQMALAVAGASFAAGSASAMLVARSADGGRTWGPISTLILDGPQFFNDKNSITADPNDPRYVYAVWDRLAASGGGPTQFARTTDGGATWEGARAIYDPGPASQTIGNVVAVLPGGRVVNLLTRLEPNQSNVVVASLHVLVSDDKGATWSGPFRIADALAVGARDPETGALIRDGASLAQIAAAPDGRLWVVWQDARFSAGAVDGIVLSQSADGGATWSAPVQVNSAPSAQAFTPSVHVLADGTIGVTYFDLRSNTGDATTLPTELILARSRDGASWTEHRISPGFDLATAPFARGLFIGDYHGLAGAGSAFVPLYVRTNSGDLSNRTDVFALATRSLPALAAAAGARALRTAPALAEPGDAFRQRVHDNLVRMLERRAPGSSRRLVAPPR
jgi:hypothetical protein